MNQIFTASPSRQHDGIPMDAVLLIPIPEPESALPNYGVQPGYVR